MSMQSLFHRASFLLIFILLAAQSFAQTRVISVAAGTGSAGFSGDGGAATAARLNAPNDVAVDPSGSLYIADTNNNRVRKITSSGVITTVAGSGNAGWFFSGGPALFASLDHPAGVAVDPSGNFYVADLLETDISRIHKINASTNTITRIELPVVINGAISIALDGAGGLYIAEEAGHRIRKLSLSSGAITTIAGMGTPGFGGDGGPATKALVNGPAELVVDSAGNLYFSDSLNNRIRKVAAGSGIITTVAGSGPAGFSGDGGPATAAQFNNPRGVAIDGAGNIFIADTMNKRIRRVSAASGVVTTLVSGDLAGRDCQAVSASLQSPDSLSVNQEGTVLYVTDVDGNRVWKMTLDPNSPKPAITSIAPGSGVAGTSVAVTISGSGFLGGSNATPSSGCQITATTVFVSGSGVTTANLTAPSDNTLRLTFVIAPDAALGPRDVTVTTDGGTSGPAHFTVAAIPIPTPTLASIRPGGAARGTTATFTLSGTNFDVQPGGTTVAVAGSGISTADVRVTGTTSLEVTLTVAPEATLGNHNVTVSTAGGTSNAVPLAVGPQGPAFTYGLPEMLNPTQNAPIHVGLAQSMPDSVTAKLRLAFVPNASVNKDDPNVIFINTQASTRTMDVTFPAGSASAQLSLPDSLVQAGTVAGTIELTVTDVTVGGMPVVPRNADFDVQIPRLPPVITNVRIVNRTSAGFDVEVTGYSTSREISSAKFNFEQANGELLLTVELQPEVSPTFGTYYQSDSSDPVGGSFVYVQPFVVKQGDAKAVASVTVALTNAAGTSEPKTAR